MCRVGRGRVGVWVESGTGGGRIGLDSVSSRAGSGRGLGRREDGWGRVGDGSDCNALLTGVTGVLHVDDMAGMRNRLKDFAKLNPIDSVKGVLWGAVPGIGSYNQFGEDGFLSLIRHCNGDEVLIPEGQSVITKKYKACELYLDWSAAFVFPNLPPIRLHTFFKAAKSGPYKYQPLTRSSKVWMNIVAKAKADYEASLLPREVDSKVSDPNLAVGLNELHKQQEAQKKALPKASRSQAQEALARRRARKTVATE